MKYSLNIKHTFNWVVFSAALLYGLFNFYRLVLAMFILGTNDTFLESLGLLGLLLVPLPAALLALRHRYIAAICLFLVVPLLIVGTLDGDAYLAKKFGTPSDPHNTLVLLVRTSALPALFALFFSITELLGWPLIYPRAVLSAID